MHFDVSATLYLYYESNTARILIYNNDIVTTLQSGPLFLLDLRIMSCSITWTYTRHIPIQQFHSPMKYILGTVLHTKDQGHNRQVYIMLVSQVRPMAKA